MLTVSSANGAAVTDGEVLMKKSNAIPNSNSLNASSMKEAPATLGNFQPTAIGRTFDRKAAIIRR